MHHQLSALSLVFTRISGTGKETGKQDVLFTAWIVLFRCADAAEAEAKACEEGIRLATQWVQGPVIIESDCARMVKALRKKEDKSELSFIVAAAIEQTQLLEERRVTQVKRECSYVLLVNKALFLPPQKKSLAKGNTQIHAICVFFGPV